MTLAGETAWLGAWRLRQLLADREISAAEVTAGCLTRIEALDPWLKAFITVAGERAMEQAVEADARAASGQPLPALHGIPVAVKDEVWTEGIPSTGGSLLYRDFVPDQDGEVAGRLRNAGAVIVGKTNMPEFAAFPRSKNHMAGESVNPYDRTRTSGASSGGSAAALAAGMVPLAIGSDGGGSIRIPASLCGVAGLYPTVGRVPDTGSFSYSPYASLGPMAREVRDVALLLDVLTGSSEATLGAAGHEVPDIHEMRASPSRRVGFSADFGYIPVSSAVLKTVREATGRLQETGAMVDDIDVRLEHVWETFFVVSAAYGRYDEKERPLPFTLTPEFDTFRRRPENFERLCPYTQQAMGSSPPTAADYRASLVRQRHLREQFEEIFRTYDVVITPTMPVVAPPVNDGWGTPYGDDWMGTPFTSVVNMLKLTAISYPVGLVDGLPVGLQIIGPGGHEVQVLEVCRHLEAVRPWTTRPDLTGLVAPPPGDGAPDRTRLADIHC
jgi:Asp-tRNA(Asn)/Glu-tRNA(Gln) amidotransferase A subunit family amidase